MVAIGRRYGSVDHSRSNTETCAACSWRVRDAHSRSRGLCRFQRLRSPTCGPSTVTMRNTWPAGTVQARPLRIGRVKDSTSVRPGGSAKRGYDALLTAGAEPAVAWLGAVRAFLGPRWFWAA